MGAFIAMIGMLLPSTTLTFAAARWGHRNREMLAVRAFKQGMAPIVTALLIATGWILIAGQASGPQEWRLWALTAATAALVLSTRIHILWLLGAGAILGACGWV
jgi:chromate transporter